MILDLTPDQQMIREEARRFLQARAASEALRQVVDSGGGTDEELWGTISRELGWCGMAIPEQYGGLGLGATELTLLLELAGSHLVCTPLWATVALAAPLLLAAGCEAARMRLLPAIASGELAATVAYPALGSVNPLHSVSIAAEAVADGYVLRGQVDKVVDLAAADLVLVPAQLADGTVALFALSRSDGFEVAPCVTLDVTRPIAGLKLDGVSVPATSRIDAGGIAADAARRALAEANLGLAAEQVGAAQGALDITLAYIAERVQFGRTIASFQAVKHRCARLVVDIAEARSLVYGAAARLDGAWDAGEGALEIFGARVIATDVQYLTAEEAIQLHGGVGFTWEYDPHLYLKRAQASASLLGARDAHLEVIAGVVLGAGVGA
ncbi:acyl-CoA/acyl-ACP dehydrogenase [Bradyrhizobium sp. U87765 SZCCT0131]|uniref:acyl-CoA dehydrogenase family protein n=1 Tax=unclassified Bradyrhizobium TaxID=2631580 RepID=UPI001BAC1F01|nr:MULTISPECIES: acyl-CoA dehydrogenase family protein [unclassified Bradyrhizobium]MBR1218018.1 acyl-CoA/acyl-ACP dehydrogenase [Bradyrhizobium sp. U87765 SZCCT0131]MBR1261036.1 acyl-CoA/acyl-ACP dehydrogenase [Bradyrhizobium sp. U87765 SZCCT0134]MBR1303516.1 acyl-CoA/acyl-ACP dehydrogenase [Bradyrhizobium sp. U87765 SZCCT0110]MBR1319122.1 acyl-CoA/acyl-ACP dehydrogenase [Bradyrhizobium sp. U87765 SZCCT0109]MBR1347447.1 acyl-CoA/acyl-ACP dehydrogenase [Bradyrhizobium sp. U87765 SZCCT0048]